MVNPKIKKLKIENIFCSLKRQQKCSKCQFFPQICLVDHWLGEGLCSVSLLTPAHLI